MPIKVNKGEWSELYAFFKLLQDKKLVSADSNLETLPGQDLDILQIIREETAGNKVIFDLDPIKPEVTRRENNSKQSRLIILPVDMATKLSRVFSKILNGVGKSFPIPETEELMRLFGLTVTRGMPSGSKEDICMVIHDPIHNSNPQVAYSIKSKAGSPATLLNASGATNFIYQLVGPGKPNLTMLNQGGSAHYRIMTALNAGYKIVFSEVAKRNFHDNLSLIDTAMPDLMALILLSHYVSNNYLLSSVVSHQAEPIELIGCNVKINHAAAKFKIGRLLSAAALGMKPSKKWDGRISATGGYIIVKKDGSLICFHVFNWDNFQDYLFNEMKFERGGETRHRYGKFYEENGVIKLKLNLQLRFIL